jgi:ribosomal protein S18 acetylase RimI-like enzyme
VTTIAPAPITVETHDRARAGMAEWIEQAALSDLHAATPHALRERAGLFSERAAGTMLFGAPGVPSVMMNRLFVADDARAESVARAVERMRERGVSQYFAHLDAQAPRALGAALVRAGLQRYHRPWVKLLIARERIDRESSVTPSNLLLRTARRQDAEAFAELQLRCMDLDPSFAPVLASLVDRPRWHVYLAWAGGRPVAAGALFVQGELGYLTFGATLPEHRGQGLQRLVLHKRMRVAVALGCRAIASETGVEVAGQKNSSCNNMQALGMQVVSTRDNYLPPGAAWR